MQSLLNQGKYLLTVISIATYILILSNFASGLETITKIKEIGYPLETHQLWTVDKFLLGLERIPYSKHGNGTIGKPVMLMHGLYLSSSIFAINNSSLSYVLSDAGFDVWLFNSRGTGLSRSLSIYDRPGSTPKMKRISWNFSFHEMGVIDMTAVIDFILKKTGYSKLDVVGYSLGATIALVGLSERPEYNSKINKLVLMAPASRLKSSGSPLNIFKSFSKTIIMFLNGFNYFPYSEDPDSSYRLMRSLCAVKSVFMLCRMFMHLTHGKSLPMYKDTVLDIISEFPQPTSSKTSKHMIQLLKNERFCHYDYGPSGNLLRYRSVTPPDYNLSKVTTPTFIVHSKDDTLIPPADVMWLISQLPNVKAVKYINKIPWGHFSFSLSPNMKEVVNSYIANQLLDYNL